MFQEVMSVIQGNMIHFKVLSNSSDLKFSISGARSYLVPVVVIVEGILKW